MTVAPAPQASTMLANDIREAVRDSSTVLSVVGPTVSVAGHDHRRRGSQMIIDCDSCEVRGNACGECVVGVLLGLPGVPRRPAERPASAAGRPPGASSVQLDAPERRALDVLADQGLVPRLRLVAAPSQRAQGRGRLAGEVREVG